MIFRKQATEQTVRAGFTLMELLVVVSIIVVLAGLGGFYYFGVQYNAKRDSAVTQMRATLAPAVEIYKAEHDVWPTSLEVLLQKDEYGRGPYLKNRQAITDPWGRFYQLDYDKTQAADQAVILCETPKGEVLSNVPLQ
jgi:general secretion pathway protein G